MKHTDLEAWKRAMELAEEVYRYTDSLPKRETYGLSSQMRRAAVSVPSNLSEGVARHQRKEFLYFLNASIGSLAELETQLILAERFGYASASQILERTSRVRALILGLRNSLRKR